MKARTTCMSHLLPRLSALAIAVTAVACSGASMGSRDTITVKTEVHVLRGESRERLGVRPDEARIVAAATSLEKTLGHAVIIEVDAALLSSTKSGAILEIADSLETLVKYFAAQSRRDPLLHAFLQNKLVRIAAHYRASAEHPTSSFDDGAGTLVCTMREPPSGGWFASGYGIERTLDDAYARHLAAHFAKTGPDVTDGELDAYFRHLTTAHPDRSKTEGKDDGAARVLAVLAFEARIRGKGIHAEAEKHLVDEWHRLLDDDNQGPAWADARAAYARWVDQRFFTMRAELRRSLYERLFREANCSGEPCLRFPELDRVRMALAFFERAPPADEGEFDAFDQALCIYEEKAGKIQRNRGCADIYGFLTETDARSEQLVLALAKTKRRELLVAALANAQKHMPSLLGALERKGAISMPRRFASWPTSIPTASAIKSTWSAPK
jgi:hypothetical protein